MSADTAGPMRILWVVEMKSEVTGHWGPTTGVRLTRSEARQALRIWRDRNPSESFRLGRYRRIEER
jgi:hypothetical protein